MTAVKLHHHEDGPPDGPVLLMGGSLGASLDMWDPQVAPLSARRRVIRFDLRGHGRSPVASEPFSIADMGADVLALMDRLGVDRAAYCGLSIGAMVGLWLAINAPRRIERLVVLCCTAHTVNPGAFHDRARKVREASATEVVADAVIANWFTDAYADAHPDVVARHRRMIVETPVQGYAGGCEAVAGHDVRDGLARIAAPTLVMAGAQDRAIPATQGAAIADAVPGARFELLDPGAHIASVERSDTVTALIAEHLDG